VLLGPTASERSVEQAAAAALVRAAVVMPAVGAPDGEGTASVVTGQHQQLCSWPHCCLHEGKLLPSGKLPRQAPQLERGPMLAGVHGQVSSGRPLLSAWHLQFNGPLDPEALAADVPSWVMLAGPVAPASP
jgi:hypothetical protein